jgi:hypothetical protein
MMSVIGVSLILAGVLLCVKPHEEEVRYSPKPTHPHDYWTTCLFICSKIKKDESRG